MNARILSARLKEDLANGKQDPYLNDLPGRLCHIPELCVGKQMSIKALSMQYLLYKSSTITGIELVSSGAYSVTAENEIFCIQDLEGGIVRKKAIASTLYMESRICRGEFRFVTDPNGYLFSYGKYPTKIFPSDLPEHFVYGYMHKRHGFIASAGVKHLLYVPNYSFNHLYKYDDLYISYNEEITHTVYDHRFKYYQGFDHVVSGPVIVDFVESCARYSGYDVQKIRSELEKKKKWYEEHYGDGRF